MGLASLLIIGHTLKKPAPAPVGFELPSFALYPRAAMRHRFAPIRLLQSYLTPAGKQAAGNLAWMLAGRVISQVCLVGVILLLTRALGPERFGIFATALALQGYIVLLATAGMPAVVVREAVRRPGEVAPIASTFLAVAWVVGLFVALMLSVTVLFKTISLEEKVVFGGSPSAPPSAGQGGVRWATARLTSPMVSASGRCTSQEGNLFRRVTRTFVAWCIRAARGGHTRPSRFSHRT